ncbi:MAG: hypothetical protein CBB60_003315 [Armatimonadetes bacterium Cent15-Ar3]|jgi:hypothetical protein|nr:MAG: hypothetical protein CBB60_003315 [Armatimonadetes bacterium Cent15-Ar3]
MSNNVATILTTAVQESAYLLNKDLDASSEELCAQSLNDKCRSILSMVIELTGFNLAVSKLLKGESVSYADMKAPNAEAGLTEARANLAASVATVCETIATISEDDWMTQVTAPWGAQITKAHAALWVSIHAMYHDGQINLIQVANGDTDVHWM